MARARNRVLDASGVRLTEERSVARWWWSSPGNKLIFVLGNQISYLTIYVLVWNFNFGIVFSKTEIDKKEMRN